MKLHLLKIPRASNNYLKPVYQSLSAKFPYPSNTKDYQCSWAPTLLNRPPIEVHILSSDPTITKIYKSLNSVLSSKSINLRSKLWLEAGYWPRKVGDWGLDKVYLSERSPLMPLCRCLFSWRTWCSPCCHGWVREAGNCKSHSISQFRNFTKNRLAITNSRCRRWTFFVTTGIPH